MAHHFELSTLALAAALCTAANFASAQSTDTVTITGRGISAVSIGGFGDVPLARSPMQASVYGAQQLAEAGITSIAGLTRLDASLADAYNTEGYVSYLTVRGFVIDNRSNYRRDGLPINAETAIALSNKERIEVLKGTSGIQAGTSAPGGLVNLIIKRPTLSVRQAEMAWRQDGTLEAAVDLGDRFGAQGQFGARLNISGATLQPRTFASDGRRSLLALATDWRISADSLIEFEFESSRQSQPSVPGFSLLGSRLPDAKSIDPRTNLNNQIWSLPVVLNGDTASLRWQQRLPGDWRFTAHGAVQRLRNDDRVAFPFGCYDAKTDVFYADRYCPDGSFDLYDFRSDNERRHVDVLDLRVEGPARTGSLAHQISAGVLSSRTQDRFNRQAYNYTGSGNINAQVLTAAAPELTDENTNRDERSTEAYLRDVVQLAPAWALWAGLRHTQLDRSSVRTDGSRATQYSQSFNTPWLALSHQINERTTSYLSWGQGVETEVVPNRSRYTNRGQALPALKSRQVEAGVKYGSPGVDWSVTAFDIRRPLAQDLCTRLSPLECTRAIDGAARHRGIEASYQQRAGAWTTQLSGLWLQAKREGATDPAANGLRPVNVPSSSLRASLGYDFAVLPGLSLLAYGTREGGRAVLPDNSITVPAWTRLDLAARYRTVMGGYPTVWQVGIDNLADHRAWREAPYQFSHVYLFPMAPRTWRASVQTGF